VLFGNFGKYSPNERTFVDLNLITTNLLQLVVIILNQRINDFENICIKCGKMYSEHPTTGRFSTVILFGHECAWNPDNEFKGFVKSTLKTSGYDLLDFGYN
jgi:hypothetical protein